MKTLKIVSFGIKNNRVLAGFMLLICGFVFPVIAVMANGISVNGASEYISFFGTIAAYFAGLLFPAVFFSYTHNRRVYDFYAAMPVKKRQYFWGYFFSGIIVFIVPLIIMWIIMAVIFGNRSELRLSYFLGPVAIFFSLYCSMTLSVMFSGSVVSAVITFLLRNIFVICLVVPILFMAGVNIESYFILLYDKAIVTAPLLGITPFLDVKGLWWIWLWQIGIGILETIAAFFLHKYRRSETTMALAFPKSRYPYQYIVTLMFVMAVNTVMMIVLGYSHGLFNIYYLERYRWEPDNIRTIVFFDVIAAFLAFILLNIVLERSSRAAFKRIRHLLFFLAGFFAVAGLAGRLTSYIPRIYTPMEPDYAIVSVYRSVDPNSVDPESPELDEAEAYGEYVCYFVYEHDKETDEFHRELWKLLKREEYFIVTSPQKLDEMVRICEGWTEYYNIANSGFTDYRNGGVYSSWNSVIRWGYYGDDAVYFRISLVKGRCHLTALDSGETVCTAYIPEIELERTGYVIGTASGLEIYKDYNVETN